MPEAIALDFFGARSTYRELLAGDRPGAAALASLGLAAGDRLLISMPTSPPGVIAFYAANKLGVVPALIHPLSTAAGDRALSRRQRRARRAHARRLLRRRSRSSSRRRPLETILLVAHPGDYLPPLKRLGFWLTKGRKIAPVPADARVRWWKQLNRQAHPEAARAPGGHRRCRPRSSSPAAPPGCRRASCCPTATSSPRACRPPPGAAWPRADSILAILPIFHGFGLGVCVNAAFMAGGTSILVPQFSRRDRRQAAARRRSPTLLVGVPTLFDALAQDPSLARADLSCLHACFSGADTLPRPVKERFEALVAERGGNVRLLEGYGLTEAVTGDHGDAARPSIAKARSASRSRTWRRRSAGSGTAEELPVGEEGEICVAGPAVMLGYLDDPGGDAPRRCACHADGRTWLHTGDLGRRTPTASSTSSCAPKRMIKSSGFNVYPAQVEAVLYQHPLVGEACVIGVPDEAQVERVVAVVVLKDPAQEGEATAQALIAFCRERLIKWSCPREIEFRRELPRTRVGKIDYKVLGGRAPRARRRTAGAMNGGERVARRPAAHGIPVLFTLCGGHISPILVAAKARGIRVVDTRARGHRGVRRRRVRAADRHCPASPRSPPDRAHQHHHRAQERAARAIAARAAGRRRADRVAGPRRAAGHRPAPARGAAREAA